MASLSQTGEGASPPPTESHAGTTFLQSLLKQRRLSSLEHAMVSHLLAQRDSELLSAASSTPQSKRLSAVVDVFTARVVDEAYSDWSTCFVGMSDQEAKHLARDGVQKLGISLSTRSLTYGEIDFFSFASILEEVNPPAGSLFVDLGHGTGRAVIAAALLRGHDLRECRGVELLPTLFAASLTAYERYKTALTQKPYLYSTDTHKSEKSGLGTENNRAVVNLIQGDFLATTDGAAQHQRRSLSAESGLDDHKYRNPEGLPDGAWADGDFIFVNSTCFSKEIMDEIAKRCAELRRGSVIVTLTSSLDLGPASVGGDQASAHSRNVGVSADDAKSQVDDHTRPVLALTGSRQFSMSWGVATAFFHIRL